jgi:hypothetical protein
MGLPLGGKEATKSLNKFLKSLLPLEFRKSMHEAERQEKIRKARPDKVFQQLGLPMSGKQGGKQRPTPPKI